MGPIKQKEKHIYQPPSWIDKIFIKTLSKEKQQYWADRILGKAGNGAYTPKTTVFKTPDDVQMGFDNNGRMVAKTRRLRRHKMPSDTQYTKKHTLPKRKR